MYQYGWLDKVTQIPEGGKVIRSFRYHMGGQFASAYDASSTETFLWDGLALIKRGTESFINEPAITGGNPVFGTESGVMFNDMLGTTLGIKGENFTKTSLTAFGESLDKDNRAFFTGKPYIGELGYVFLFRNYRADMGKWQTADPLGYPDGWNNFAYVNNGVTMAIDWLGTITIFVGGASEHILTKTMSEFMENTCPRCGQLIGGGSNLYAWTDKNEIIEFINTLDPDEPLRIVGHSYGGDTAYLVARDCGRNVEALVTFDAVSNLTFNISPPSNVDNWYNIYVTGGNYDTGDLIADLGGHWQDIDGATNIEVPDVQHGDVAGMMNYISENGYSNVWGILHVCE